MNTEKQACYTYCRVSSKKQERGLSLSAQEKLLKNWAMQNNYLLVEPFIEVHSAKSEGRPVFNRMIKSALEEQIKHIAVEKTDRLQRSKEDEIFIEKLTKENDFIFHLIQEGRALSKDGTATDELLSDVQGMVARHELRVLKERVEKGLQEKLDRNELPCQAPIGYKNIARTRTNGGKCVTDENFNKVKKFLLIFLKGGRTLSDMERVAENLGLKSKRGNRLTKPTIRWMLRNPFYYGEFEYAGARYKNKTEGFKPMITKKQYEKILKILDGQRLNKGIQEGKDWKYKNLVHCGKCGRIYLANKMKIKYDSIKTGKSIVKEYVQYHCTSGDYFVDEKVNLISRDLIKQDEAENYYYEKGSKRIYVEKKPCKRRCITEHDLGKLLTQEFGALKFNRRMWNKIKTQLLKNEKHSRKLISEELQMLRSEQTKNKTKQETLYEDKLNNVIREGFFKEQMKKIDNRQDDIEGRIEELEEDEKSYDEKIEQAFKAIDDVDNFKDKFIAAESPEVRRQMVKRMCNKIFIMGGEKRPDSTKKFLKKFPYELYVEWNDGFNELYEIGLFEMAEEARTKYGLPKKAFINSKNSL